MQDAGKSVCLMCAWMHPNSPKTALDYGTISDVTDCHDCGSIKPVSFRIVLAIILYL